MDNKFINRSKERNNLTNLIEENSRINIIFSNEGFGKTALLEDYLNNYNSDTYIRVCTDDLFAESAPEYYFITKIISSISEKFNLNDFENKSKKIWDKQKSNLSISLNIGPIGIGYALPQEYKVRIDDLIKAIKLIDDNIYIHIENIQKIDHSSLNYMIRLINETNNVMFFLECSNDFELCNKLKNIFFENKMSIGIMPIDKLEWSHVSIILKNLNIVVNPTVEKEYESLQGNLKKLIFNNTHDCTDKIVLDTEQQFILHLIQITGTNLSAVDFHSVLMQYDPASRYLFSLPNLRNYLNSLLNWGLIAESNFDHYYITVKGIKFLKNNNADLIVSMLSNYYLPIISNDATCQEDKIKGLRVLLDIYLKYNDSRIVKIIPYIEPNLLLLNLDKNILDRIYICLKQIFEFNLSDSMLYLARSYIKLNCFNEAKEILDKYITHESNLSIVLYSTVLIHLEKNTKSTELYIKNNINQTSDITLKSALHTCLVSLYMQTKSIKEVLTYVENLKKEELTKTDYHIIQKNISIFFNNEIAFQKLSDCYKYFLENKHNRLAIATAITLATKYAQAGDVNNARDLLSILCDNKYLSLKDLNYIDNNVSVLDMLQGGISNKTINKLKESYIFCTDHYTRLLIANNILIYYVLVNELEKARLYADEIEKEGLDIYNFDDYLHLAYLNLRFFYDKSKNFVKVNYYNEKLKELQEKCHSSELRTYINANLSGNNTLNTNERWHYMASYRYRPAFVGHWIINDFDC